MVTNKTIVCRQTRSMVCATNGSFAITFIFISQNALMKYILKPLQVIYTIYALLLFIVLMLLVLPFIIGFSFLGQIKGGNLIYKVCNVWGVIWYALIGVWEKNIYEAPHDTTSEYV